MSISVIAAQARPAAATTSTKIRTGMTMHRLSAGTHLDFSPK
jgi:hypothetical protein